MKALVVDDSALARKMISNALKLVGFDDIVEAQDGEQAVSCAGQSDFDMVCMDWNMPNLQGIDAVRQIRATGNSVPIIMVTGLSDAHHIREAIQAGINNFLVKPFQPQKASELIQKTMEMCELVG